ncbi:meiotic recombination protein SPO11-like isoform X1 [Octopus sinensis]|uniref:DNA topoisomerase (ATP-hydrolyzing) n=1 Tax=Octopus sinensis TaxID=2607531 RepID=A0A7E6F0B1_9MOLL|nr:meiotic recombination protein SPO11-like isoform X1 [Octopus sinensis]
MTTEDVCNAVRQLRKELIDDWYLTRVKSECNVDVNGDQVVPFNTFALKTSIPRIPRCDILRKIENIILKILKSLEKGIMPSFEYANHSSWDNIKFSVEFGLETIMEPKTSKISFGSKRSRKKFDLLLKLLAIIYQLVQTDAYRTKRDIYYQNVNCFKTQSVLDTLLNNISHLLEVPRWDLHVLSTSKGCIAGDLQFHDANGNFICCKNTKSGIMLPSNVMEINNIYTHALFILVVEKDATFQHLLNYGISEQFPHIIITGKGFPDINTRLLLKTLWNELRIPVFGLMDADAHGIEIMFVYKFGSKCLSSEVESLAVPTLKWLGLFPSDIKRLGIPENQLIPVTEADIAKAKSLKNRSFVKSNRLWLQELEILLEQKQKAELQSLNDFSFTFLPEVYILQKIASKGWL